MTGAAPRAPRVNGKVRTVKVQCGDVVVEIQDDRVHILEGADHEYGDPGQWASIAVDDVGDLIAALAMLLPELPQETEPT